MTPRPPGRRILLLAAVGGLIGGGVAVLLIAVRPAVGVDVVDAVEYTLLGSLVVIGAIAGALVALRGSDVIEADEATESAVEAVESGPDAVVRGTAEAAALDAVAEATRELARSTDSDSARAAICDGAREVSGAPVSIMFEPDPTGVGLSATAALGAEVEGVLLPFVGEPAGAVRAYTSGEPFFLSNVVGHPAVTQSIVRTAGAVSAFWQPVRRGGAVIGVLTVMWRERVEEAPSERLISAMNLLAAEAAVAIDRADLLRRLEGMARTDELTGLPNRRAWDEELPRELARARRSEQPVSVAMLDLDRFKEFNDRHGHQAGDRLLKEAAVAWRDVLRETDLLARYGGEEFAVILGHCGMLDAGRLVARLRSGTPEGETCSAGIAEWDGEETPESLVGRADEALYEAKRMGRNRTVSSPTVTTGD